jgi:MFS family permease
VVTVATLTISLFGSQMSSFALAIWMYQRTGLVTLNALLYMATITPEILLAPIAGVFIDRYDRGRILLLGQAGAGLCSLAMLLAHRHGLLAPSLALVLIALASLARAAEYTALTSSVSLLVAPAQLGRANGAVQMALGIGQIAAPMLAGLILPLVHLDGILALDLASFVVAVTVFARLRLPRPARATTAPSATPLRTQVAFGYRWVRARPALFQLLLFWAASNAVTCMAEIIITPLVLGFANERGLGIVSGAAGLGMFAGSIFMIVTGGPRRRVLGVLCGSACEGALLCLAAVRPSLSLMIVAAFGAMFAFPIMAASSDAIWQRKTPPELQGRVFSFRYFFARSSIPLATLGVGPVTDLLFEPLLRPHGALAATVGAVFGVGPGRGSGLFLTLIGVCLIGVALAGLGSPRLRRLEIEIPNHDAKALAPDPALAGAT